MLNIHTVHQKGRPRKRKIASPDIDRCDQIIG